LAKVFIYNSAKSTTLCNIVQCLHLILPTLCNCTVLRSRNARPVYKVLITDRVKIFFSSPSVQTGPLAHITSIFNGYQGAFPKQQRSRGLRHTTHFHLVQRVTLRATKPSFPILHYIMKREKPAFNFLSYVVEKFVGY
jgi:hypothetical protein